MNSIVETRKLSVSKGGRSILDEISFALPEASIASILGPSGCGKTTLLRCIAGFEKPRLGEIFVNGVRASNQEHVMPVEEREIGMVFQDFALFPHLDVADNIKFGLQQRQSSSATDRVEELLDLLSLQEHVNKFPHQLSGGQQQRVALARAMAPRPRVMLLDEPFASLDVELREQLALELRHILKQDGVTTIMVSHNQLEAFAMADVIGVMNKGQLLQWDSAFNLYHRPATEQVADLIGEGVFIAGQVISATEVNTAIGIIKTKAAHALDSDVKVNVLIRPDDIVHDEQSPMHAIVIDKAFRGANYLYTLEGPDGARLLSLIPSHHDHPVNEAIGIRLDVDHLVMFPVSS